MRNFLGSTPMARYPLITLASTIPPPDYFKKINLLIVTYIRLSYIPIYHSGQIRIYFHSLLPTSFSAPRLIFVVRTGFEPV